MEVTLTVHGTPDEIRRVLDAIEGHGGAGTSPGELTERRLHRFVGGASEPMLAALQAIAEASAREEALPRPALAEAVGLGGDAELNGVLGSIGRAWARTIGGENPFLGVSLPDGTIAYRIDREVADRLQPVLRHRAEGGWAIGMRGRRGRGRGRRHVE